MADETIGSVEQKLAGLPTAVAGLESRIAGGFKSILGVGEEVANLTGLNHVAGIFEQIAHGTDKVLSKVDAGEQVISHTAVVAQAVTPASIAAFIIPESARVMSALQQAADLVTKFNVSNEIKVLVLHNYNLVKDADIALRALETGTQALVDLPFLHFSGTLTATLAAANAFLHWLEPKLSAAISDASSGATPSVLPPTHGSH
jgi:hypothetical protein